MHTNMYNIHKCNLQCIIIIICIFVMNELYSTYYMYIHYYVLYVRLTVSLTVCGWGTYNLMVGKVVVNVGMQISALDDVTPFKYFVQ